MCTICNGAIIILKGKKVITVTQATKKPEKKIREIKQKLVKTKKQEKTIHKKLSSLEILLKEIVANKSAAKEIGQHTKNVSAKHAIQNKKKLTNINTLEKKTIALRKKIKQSKQAEIPQQHIDELKAIATEITKHRIVTDFDRVLFYVNEHTRTSSGQISKDLSIDKKRVQECAQILEESKLVEIDYPLFGDIMLQIVDYKQKLKKEKADKKQKNKKKQ